jgi:D-alanyl-lipoteichoic acid acyltransferase DltB (MBOAT superfamily)
MNDLGIDLYSLPFWVAVVAAVLLMSPLTSAGVRKALFALVNLGFLALYLREGVALVLAGVLVAWLALQLMARGRAGAALVWPSAAAVLTLFLGHKMPGLAQAEEGLAPVGRVLSVVGFSYVALRLVEVGRAVRDGRHPAPDLAATVNYLLPFHMIAAGPIQSYDEFAAQPGVQPALGPARSLGALERIATGMFKKYILANLLEQLFMTGFRAGGAYTLFEVQVTYLWLYLDFSAYSDIAVGVGRLIGVATPENFDRPYLARNVIDFWERWHISLSQFIRRNVFIPTQLALMRRTGGGSPLLVASVAFTVSFLLCGLWHGLSWPWLAWGAYQAAGLTACNVYRSVLLKRLGRKGVNRYLENRWVHLLAVALTFEFSAVGVAIVTFPFEDLPWRVYSLTH